MICSIRIRKLARRIGRSALGASLALALLTPVAEAAAPAKATSFVRGGSWLENDASAYPQRAFVGDVNGDGRDDTAFTSGWGASTTINVIYGATPTANVDLTADLGTRGFRILPGANGGVLDVAGAGDFDGDGYDDLIVSTDLTSFVVYGAPSTTATLTLAAGGRMTALTGKGATDIEDDADPAGDFDGDGYDDIVVQRGDIGAAIVAGGPRVNSIALGSATGRVSLINSQQRCGFVWFTFKCVYMGVPVEPLGDFDGDGKADLAVENANNPGNYVLYGRTGRFTTVAEAGSGKTTLPTPSQGEVASEISDYSAAGDITGDGLADALAWGTLIVPGRTGRPSSIANSSPVIRLTSPTLSRLNAFAAGDQDGDGRADLVVATGGGAGSGYVIRTLTTFTRTAPATVNADTGTAIAGVPSDYVAYTGTGDLDGDRLGDLIVATAYPGESAYLVTHGTGSPGSGTRSAALEGDFILVDAAGAPVTYWSGTLQATCAGRTTAKLPLGYPHTTFFTDLSEGDACVVTGVHTLDNPAASANCTWVDTVVLNDEGPVTTPDRSFKVAAGLNNVRVIRQCKLPLTAPPTALSSTGWLTAGIATQPEVYGQLALTDGANQTSSLVWPYPVDYRNRTIEFNLRMAGGNGAAEGMTLAFVRTGAYGPAGGTVGGGGQLLGFGGLVGSAVAFDVNRGPGDPSSNFLGFTNTMISDDSLSWQRTANAVASLRDPGGHRIKIVNKNGTTTVSIDGTVRMSGALSIPAKTHLAFTASTSAIYQYTNVWNLSISAS